MTASKRPPLRSQAGACTSTVVRGWLLVDPLGLTPLLAAGVLGVGTSVGGLGVPDASSPWPTRCAPVARRVALVDLDLAPGAGAPQSSRRHGAPPAEPTPAVSSRS